MAIENFKPTIWSARLIANLDKNLVMANLINTDYEGEIQGAGDTVKILGVGDVTINSYSGTVTYEDGVDLEQNLTVDQQKYFAVNLDDVDKVQAQPNVMDKYMERGAYGLADAFDSYVLGLYASAGNTVTDASLDSATVLSTIGSAAVALDNNNVPKEGRFLVVSPWVHQKMVLAGIIRNTDNPEILASGMVGRVQGFDVYVSNNVNNASSTVSANNCIAGHRDAIASARQLTVMEAVRRDGSFKTAVRGLYVYGAKVIQPKALVNLVVTYAAETAI